MILKKLKPMPKDFLWGASTSAYQVEGANLTHGKGPSVQDIKKVPEGTSELDVCADFYHHYKEDIALMAEMGFKTFRFSVAWSRILPEGTGAVNQEGIDFYNNVIDECLKYNIEPLVTMFHFDLPAALEKKGGWSRRESVDEFVNFAKILYENYGDRVKYWLTINEQNVLTLNGEVIGTCDLKGVDNKYKKLYQENHHMLLAQAKAMALCHEMVPGGKIGPAPNISLVYPASCKPKDVLAAQNLNAIRNWLYLDMAVFGRYNNLVWAFLEEHDATPVIEDGDMDIMASAHPDFIGFNYYSTATVEWNDGTEPAGRGDQQISGDEPGVFKAYPNPNVIEKTADDDSDNILRLFGCAKKDKLKNSRLIFSDMVMDNWTELKKLGLQCQTEAKFENTISRMTSEANPRQIERVVRGATFPLQLIYNVENEDEIIEDITLLKEGMTLLSYDYLGGSGSRGYGKVKFSGVAADVVVGDVADEIIDKCNDILAE